MLQERRRRLLLLEHKRSKRTKFSPYGILLWRISDTANEEAEGKSMYLDLLQIVLSRKAKSGRQMLPARILALVSFLIQWLMTTYKVSSREVLDLTKTH